MASEIRRAIERWTDKGLIDPGLAARLLDEAEQAGRTERTRTFQYVLGGSAGLVVLIAAGVFLSFAWPNLSDAVRTMVLAGAGVALLLGGSALEARRALRPVAYLLQTSGLLVLLLAFVYSDEAWGGRSPMRFVVALAALATPVIFTLRAVARNAFMPAVNAAFGYAFLFVSLDRLGVDTETAIWVVDAVLVATLALLVVRMRRATHPEDLRWELGAFITSMFAGFPLVAFTMADALSGSAEIVYGLDLWLVLTVCVTLWAVHRAPTALRRSWYRWILGGCVLLAIVLAYWTAAELRLADGLSPIAPALVGMVALVYAVRTEIREVMVPACLAIVIAAWHFGLENGRALGAVVALVFTAALLFWLAARLGKKAERAEAAGPPSP